VTSSTRPDLCASLSLLLLLLLLQLSDKYTTRAAGPSQATNDVKGNNAHDTVSYPSKDL